MKTKLKVGQQYIVIKDEYNYGLKTPRIVRVKSLGVEESFFDEKDYFYDTLSSQFELQLIKSKTKKVNKFSTDGEHFYINKQPVCEKEFLEQSKNIREIDKIKDIIKSNKLQYPNPFGKYIQVKRYNEILLPKIENELIEMLLATQSQPIKEECKHELGDIEEHDNLGTYHTAGDTCIKCGKHILDFDNPKQQSKDIEFEEIEELKKYTEPSWQKFIEDNINAVIRNQNKLISLTKRNKK